MLSPYRVLDLANERGMLCGQILADLGADVILVEPPAGSPARRVGPFYKDERHPERSLFFQAYARNKRGIALDLESAAGRAELVALARGADFLIESERPGRMAELGLDYASLEPENPALVYVSITTFGQDGPKAGYADTDLIALAASGPLYLSGEEELPPLRVSVPQAHAHAGAEAAVAALIAHLERRRSGRGQHVDVSAQQALALATLFRILDVPWGQPLARRQAGGWQVGKAFIRNRYPTRDGLVALGPGFLPSTGPYGTRLSRWLVEEDLCDESFAREDWNSYGIRLLLGQIDPEHYAPLDRALERLFAARTNLDVLREATARKLLIAPALGLDELTSHPHFAEREAFLELQHPELGAALRYPGPFARFGHAGLRYRRLAPRLGEHTGEVLSEPRGTPVSAQVGARDGPAATAGGLPLEGVKILDLFWVLAGPGATRMLADYGATVVHVESQRRLDTIRTIPPYRNGVPHPENAACVQGANAGKLCITLDLAHPEAREIVHALVRWADVVTESFAAGVAARLGVDYESLRRIRPDLIMISSCLMGQTGALRDFAGFGNLAASVTGFQQFAGWPGRQPTGPAGAYTDYIAVRYNAIAILAALEHRARTGEGQRIDQSQAEAALHFLAPALLEHSANGRATTGAGNDDPDMFPHGVYSALGDDRWVAIAARDDADWRRLCEVLGRVDLRDDPDLATAELRRARRDEVDAAISAWTRARESAESERELQSRGVAAHAVLDMADLYGDAQLRWRGHFVEIPHPIHQTVTVESSRFRLSRTPARVPARAVTFGCDNQTVLEGLLGYGPERIAELAARGVLL